MNPLIAQLTHRPFRELADAIRTRVDRITLAWDAAVRKAMPQMQRLTFDELKDSTPEILNAIADALASDDPKRIDELVDRAPAQGLSRLRLNFDVIEVMQEDRLLRSLTVRHVEEGLDRRMDASESEALHAAIDVMLQRSVIALVEQQKLQLRAAAETELKFLSFLSHDLNNNLNGVIMMLQSHGMDLKAAGGFAEAEESLQLAQQAIHDTVAGMRQMLEHERMRTSGEGPIFSPVDLHAAATKVVTQFREEARSKGTELSIEMRPGTVVESNADLLSIVLQNLVGNGVKFATGGKVCIGFDRGVDTHRPVLWVSDDGPGISPEMVEHIFEAFRRGDVHGQQGVGLGLAIASQAANLLGAGLTVESKVGVGSTFRLVLPQNASIGIEASTRSYVSASIYPTRTAIDASGKARKGQDVRNSECVS
jgi:signal transduction histidine kinase